MTPPKYNTFGRKLSDDEGMERVRHNRAADALRTYSATTNSSDLSHQKKSGIKRAMEPHFGKEETSKMLKEHETRHWGNGAGNKGGDTK